MQTFLKGDTTAEMAIALAAGFDYTGKTVHLEYQGVRRSFADAVAGGVLKFSFSAEETAPMSLGAYPVHMWIEGADGSITSIHNSAVRLRVTDTPADVRGESAIYLDVRGGLYGIDGLPDRWNENDLHAKINEIIRRLGGTVAVFLLCALPAFAASLTVETAPKGAVYNDEAIVTNVTLDVSDLATKQDVADAVPADYDTVREQVATNAADIAQLAADKADAFKVLPDLSGDTYTYWVNEKTGDVLNGKIRPNAYNVQSYTNLWRHLYYAEDFGMWGLTTRYNGSPIGSMPIGYVRTDKYAWRLDFGGNDVWVRHCSKTNNFATVYADDLRETADAIRAAKADKEITTNCYFLVLTDVGSNNYDTNFLYSILVPNITGNLRTPGNHAWTGQIGGYEFTIKQPVYEDETRYCMELFCSQESYEGTFPVVPSAASGLPLNYGDTVSYHFGNTFGLSETHDWTFKLVDGTKTYRALYSDALDEEKTFNYTIEYTLNYHDVCGTDTIEYEGDSEWAIVAEEDGSRTIVGVAQTKVAYATNSELTAAVVGVLESAITAIDETQEPTVSRIWGILLDMKHSLEALKEEYE